MWRAFLRVWNESDHLSNTINALLGHIDQIIIIDGAYSYFPYKHSPTYNKPYSTDGTLDIVRSFMHNQKTEIILIENKDPIRSEIVMFNMALRNYGKIGDYYLKLDGHDILHGDFSTQKQIIEDEQWDIGGVAVCLTEERNSKNIPKRYIPYGTQRIIKWHPRLHVRRVHWNFFFPYPVTIKPCKHIFFYHYKRNKEREFINDIHYAYLKKFNSDDICILQHRRTHNIPNGYVDIKIPKREFDPYVESTYAVLE